MALARRKLEQRCGRALCGVLAFLTNEPPNYIVHERRCRPHQCSKVNVLRRLAP